MARLESLAKRVKRKIVVTQRVVILSAERLGPRERLVVRGVSGAKDLLLSAKVPRVQLITLIHTAPRHHISTTCA
jgi:hypothetical protein